mgnify:FL=1
MKDKTYTNEIFDIFFYKADEDGNPLKNEKGKTIVFVSTREVEELDIIVPTPHDEDLLECEWMDFVVVPSDENQRKMVEIGFTPKETSWLWI